MLKALLRRFVSVHQGQIFPLAVAIVAGGLGMRIGVRACYALAPSDSAFDFAALVVVFKFSKFCFAPRALLGIRRAISGWERIGHLALLALVVALMAGSIGPSYAYTTHNEALAVAAAEASKARAVAESDSYAAISKDIEAYDEQIAILLRRTNLFLEANKPTKSMENDEMLGALRAQKKAAIEKLDALHPASPVPPHSDGIGRWIHLASAIALELVGVAASVLVRTGRSATKSAPIAHHAGSESGTVVPIAVKPNKPETKSGSAAYPAVGARFTGCLQQARRLIQADEMRPTLDALWAKFGVSQRPAKRILEALCAEGVVRWNGHRYERCAPVPSRLALAM